MLVWARVFDPGRAGSDPPPHGRRLRRQKTLGTTTIGPDI